MNQDKEIIVATINLDFPSFINNSPIEEALHINLGSKNKAGDCFIKVKGNEGLIPHFHIESQSNKSFYCCVRLYEAGYFHHLDKEVDLTSKQAELLNSLLTEDMWKDLCNDWIDLNVNTNSEKGAFKNYLLDIGIENPDEARKPNYSKL